LTKKGMDGEKKGNKKKGFQKKKVEGHGGEDHDKHQTKKAKKKKRLNGGKKSPYGPQRQDRLSPRTGKEGSR